MKASEQNVSASLPRIPVARLVASENNSSEDLPIQAVRFTEDGKYCVTAGHDRTVRLWNPSRLDPAFPPPPPPSLPSSSSLSAASSAVLQRSTRDSSIVGSQEGRGRGRGGLSNLPAWMTNSANSNNKMQAQQQQSGLGKNDTGADNDIPLDQLPRAFPIKTYRDGYTHPISAVAMDASNKTLAAASEKTLVITDALTGQIKRRHFGHVGRINAVAISDGSETFVTASYDATVRIWDGRSRSNEPIQVLKEAKDSVTDVHLVQQQGTGQQALAAALIRTASVDGIIRTYDIRRGVLECDDCHHPVTCIAPTRDGKSLVVSCLNGSILLMDLDTGQVINTYASHHVAGTYGLQCCVSADDMTIVSGSEDGRAVLYDLVRANCVQKLEGHTRPTCSVAACPRAEEEPSAVITASYDGSAVVWAHDADYMRWQ